MKKNTTRRALLLSVLSLIMCASMLIGTTYAWFTDTVASTGNKIQSGTLDVELWMADADGNYVDISDDNAPIFSTSSNKAQNVNSDTLWEPGKTQVAYLAIKNAGNLALKYTVGLKVYDVTKNLNEAMSYVIIPDAQPGDVTAWPGNGNRVALGTQSVSGHVSMLPNSTHYFALAIHMDELAGNEYQDAQITFDLTVLATQFTYESDSFGDQYDKDATYSVSYSPAYQLPTEDGATYSDFTLQTNETNPASVSGSAALVEQLAEDGVNSFAFKTTEAKVEGNTVNFADVGLYDEKGNEIDLTGNTEPMTVKLFIGKQFAGETMSVAHDGVVIGSGVIDAEGYITYTATHFCEVTVTSLNTTVYDEFAAQLNNAKEGDTVTLTLTEDAYFGKDAKLLAPYGVDVVFNGNGHTVYCDDAIHVIAGQRYCDLTINDLTILGSTIDDAIVSQNNGVGSVAVVMNNVTVNLDKISGVPNWPVCIGGSGTVKLTNCTITGAGLPSGDYADGNVFFIGGLMNLTLENCNIDSVMLNNDNSTMVIDDKSKVGTVYLEAKDPSVVSGSVENVGEMIIPVKTAADFKKAIETANAGDTVCVALAKNLEATLDTTSAAGVNVVIYGCGKTINTTGMQDKYFFKSNGGAVEINDLTITGDAKYAYYSVGGKAVFNNVKVSMDGNYKVCFYGGGKVELNNCTINGNASFVNIWFGDGRQATINGGTYSSMCINASNGAGIVSAGTLVVNDADVDIIYGGALEVNGEIVRATVTNNNSNIGKIEFEM